MKHIKLFEQFITEKEGVGKYNTVKKVVSKLGKNPSEQELAKFIIDNYYDVTEVELGEDDPKAYDKIADLVSFYKFDIDEWESAWGDVQNESVVNEAKSKLFAALEKSDKLTEPSGGSSLNGKYYQLTGGSKYDIIHFDYDPKSSKPFGVAQVAGHHIPMQILNKLGFKETNSWTAGVEVYIFDGNYNPTWLTEDQMSDLVDDWSKGFGSYAKSISDFYKKRGKTSGTID